MPADDQPAARERDREVRLTVQRLVERHLKPDSSWCVGELDINLRGAHLIGFDLSGARVSGAIDLRDARFAGPARFDRALFASRVFASGARFQHHMTLAATTFASRADFSGSEFEGTLQGSDAAFISDVTFAKSKFGGDVVFADARFASGAIFAGARFKAGVGFFNTQFVGQVQTEVLTLGGEGSVRGPGVHGGPIFKETEFTELVLRGATIDCSAVFTGATVSDRLTTVAGTDHRATEGPLELGEIDVWV